MDRRDERARMVAEQVAGRGVRDRRVLAAMLEVPRHLFLPEGRARGAAYDDHALAIGHHQTISQPYIVGFMTERLQVEPGMRVLELGTGSGYQTAVLLELGAIVYSIEIIPALAAAARSALDTAGYLDESVHLRAGDAHGGWPEEAPFDRILGTAAPSQLPEHLISQLRLGGRMVLPVGSSEHQDILVVERSAEGYEVERTIPVVFVPMTGDPAR